MGREIERKFLVAGEGWRAAVRRVRRFEQAYLAATERVSVRVRIVEGAAGWLTMKSRTVGALRDEFEYPVPVEDARQMMLLRTGNIVAKTRHDVALPGALWEVDVFDGVHLGLVIAECELPHADAPLELPEWLGREVTADARYYNDALSRGPAPAERQELPGEGSAGQ